MNRPTPPLPPQPDERTRVIDSRQLFAPGQSTVQIAHAGQRYILRLTRENKLILTK